MRRETRAWCSVTLRWKGRQRVLETENMYCSCCIIVELITFYQRISRIIFKFCFSRTSSPSRTTKSKCFGNFTRLETPGDKLWLPKTVGQVLGYTTVIPMVLLSQTLNCHWKELSCIYETEKYKTISLTSFYTSLMNFYGGRL